MVANAEQLYELARHVQHVTLGHPWFVGPYNLNVIGYKAVPEENLFNDVIAFIYEDGHGRPCVERFPATTDPGRAPVDSPRHPRGTFCMMPQRVPGMWTRGIHNGRSSSYPALVHRAGVKIRGWRGTDRVRVYDDARGINCHHAHGARLVDWFSEGCQVMQRKAHLDRALWLYDMQLINFPKARSVSYTLNDVEQLPELSPMLVDLAR